jgi:hypothetical protein
VVDRREAEKNTLGEILLRYRAEVTPAKKSASIEAVKIDVILKDAVLPKLKMSAVTSSAVAAWRDRRLKQVSGATVNREIDVLSAVSIMPAANGTCMWRTRSRSSSGPTRLAPGSAIFRRGGTLPSRCTDRWRALG